MDNNTNNKSVIFDEDALEDAGSASFAPEGDKPNPYGDEPDRQGGIGSTLLRVFFIGGLITLLFFYVWPNIIVVVRSGEAAVKYRMFGGGVEIDKTYGEGFHLTAPWNTMFIYSLRDQDKSDSIIALTKDGLELGIVYRVAFNPIPEHLPLLHREMGLVYSDKMIKPTASTAIREVVSQFYPQDIYSMNRALVQNLVLEALKSKVQHTHMEFSTVQILAIKLPKAVSNAIESKLIKNQEQLEYEYRLLREKKEADRKLIEAKGIKAFSDSAGIDMMKWKGLQVTEELAKSPNSKIVIIGTDDKSLPLILGNDK